MGVVYRLKQEIIELILKEKEQNPQLSCRKLAALMQEKHKIHVSKSSVNTVLKAHKLSLPVGRQRKKTKKAWSIKLSFWLLRVLFLLFFKDRIKDLGRITENSDFWRFLYEKINQTATLLLI